MTQGQWRVQLRGFRTLTPCTVACSRRGTYDSVYGTIVSAWTARPDVVHEKSGISDMSSYSAVVPPNTTAVLYLPLGQTIHEKAVKGFKGAPGVTFVAITRHNNIDVAEFRLAAGGYDFKVVGGALVAALQKGYVAY